MLIIATEGSIYFIEDNPLILWGEISVSILITAFATYVLIVQIGKLGERRENDRRSTDRRQQ
jgi:hypothetical protein